MPSDSATSISSNHVSATTLRKLTWRLLPFLFLLYVVAYIDRINIGFAALQMQSQLGFNDAVYGLGAGMFFAGYLIFQIPSNWALERVGARRWIAFLLLTWGVISASMMFISGSRSFYALRFLLGVAEAGFFPGIIFHLRNWFPSAARARAVAIFMTASPMAGVFGGPISGALLNLDNIAGLAGWQWMFLIEGIPAILLSGVVVRFLADTPHESTWLSDVERDWLISTLDKEHEQTIATSSNRFAVLQIGAVWLLTVVYFGMSGTTYGISFWLPKLIRSQSDLSNFQIGLLIAVPYIFAAVVMVFVGLHSDRTGERRLHVAGCGLVGVVSMVLAAYSGSFIPMLLGISIALMSTNSMFGPFWAMPTGLLPRALAATGIALINSLGNIGGFVIPYLIGLLKTSSGDFRGGLLVVAGFLAITSLATFMLGARVRNSPVNAVKVTPASRRL